MEVLDLDSVDWKASRRDRNRGGPKWKMLTPMSTPRSSHTVEVLDGVIYVVGGGDGREWLCTAESYNPKTLRWSPIARYEKCPKKSDLLLTSNYFCNRLLFLMKKHCTIFAIFDS